MMRNKIITLFFVLVFSIGLTSAAVQFQEIKFVPQNNFERDVKGWLEKTEREFALTDSKDPQHHFYLFNVLQSTLLDLSLERRQALLNAQDDNGNTAAHRVILQDADQERIIMLLRIFLFAGVDIKCKNKKKETIIRLANKVKKKRVIAFLIAQKNK